MIHPDTKLQFIDDEIGYGVIATKKIPKGTITWALDAFDREFSPQEVLSMEPVYREILEKYSYRDYKGNLVLCWDFGRFVNHSFNSNCMSTAYEFEIAIRDIEPGEELTDDYGYLNVTDPFQGRDENTSRKFVYPDDLLRFHSVWDRLVIDTLPFLHQVKQPLYNLLGKEVKQEIRDILNGKKEMRSLLETYYPGPKQLV